MNIFKQLFQKEKVKNNNSILSIGDKIILENEEVRIIDIIPHPEIKNSVYYKFDNGKECRDIRLKQIIDVSNK